MGQPLFFMNRKGKPKGRSIAAIHGWPSEGVARNVSNSLNLDHLCILTGLRESPTSWLSKHVIGFLVLGRLVKSIP